MKFKIIILALIASTFLACNSSHEHVEAPAEQKKVKFQYTAYTDNFELFAEADAFIVGEKANVLSHFSTLPDFKPVEKASITIVLNINGKEVRQKLDKPTRKGIFSFDITPEIVGKGTLKFEIANEKGNFTVDVPEVIVFKDLMEAEEVASKIIVSETNATFFTKEQSWKIDFATGFPLIEPFGQVIKTIALVQSSQDREVVVSAKTNGIVLFNFGVVLEGQDVSAGQALFLVSGSNFADNNIAVKYFEAKNNFEKAYADYERVKELAKDKIISQKDLLTAQNQYENAKLVFDNLNKNFNASGQIITSPQAGFIKQMFVKNGTYVEAGQPIAVISQNKSLVLRADVPLRFAPVLTNIKTAHILNFTDKHSYTLEELKGKVLSYGKATNTDNFHIPLYLQVENNGVFVLGSFVEVYLKTFDNSSTITVPNSALLEEQGSFFVWVQIHPELFEKREVTIGANDGLKTEIKKGISPTERIVTRGAMLIKLAQATGVLDAHSGHNH